jgi:ribosomal protein S21
MDELLKKYYAPALAKELRTFRWIPDEQGFDPDWQLRELCEKAEIERRKQQRQQAARRAHRRKL